MTRYEKCLENLERDPQTWLITGGAGFIGSNLCEALLRLDQNVIALDNLSNGFRQNIASLVASVGAERATKLKFIEGDIRDFQTCERAAHGVRYILHQAALGSVPRSLTDPFASHDSNVTGSLNVFNAGRAAGCERIVFASSSSVYGDSQALPKVEGALGRPLSPYAATKLFVEIYAEVLHRCFAVPTIGLRYFNVFGPRQRTDGPYSAVIPRWIGKLLSNEAIEIYGDGETRRDFSYVANIVQANLLAATAASPAAHGRVFNIAFGRSTALRDLSSLINNGLKERVPGFVPRAPIYRDFRSGDIRDSLADIAAAAAAFGYEPTHDIEVGLRAAMDWYVADFSANSSSGGQSQ